MKTLLPRTSATVQGVRRVVLAGNPNTGKTTLFNRLTGENAKVGNYPGITVERHHGRMRLDTLGEIEVLDVPGTYSLVARSPEEQLAIRSIAGLHPLEQPDVTVVVVDATQLERNLYLVLQVLELGRPTVVALNMVDQLANEGLRVDDAELSRVLGIPVVPVVASRGQGLETLRAVIERSLIDPPVVAPPKIRQLGSELLHDDLVAVEELIPVVWHQGDARRRTALALWALLSIDEDDELEDMPPDLRAEVLRRRHAAEAEGRSIEEEIIRARYDWIETHMPRVVQAVSLAGPSLTDRIDRVLLHPTIGFAIFLVVMTVVFQSLFAWADPVIGYIESLFAWLGSGAHSLLPEGVLADLVANGLIAGVGSVLVFLPQILLLFFFIGLMEDTGYMARVAYLMDRLMKAIGLHGRAFVPMLSGYACAVPAILATRTMERKRDRLLTMMVVPLMTCSARLPVYGLLIAALYPPGEGAPFVQGLLMVGMYLFSTVVALLAAGVLGRTVLKGKRMPLLLEMPPYRVPHWASVLRMMWQRSSIFVKEAGTVILACSVAMWFLLSFPRPEAGSTADQSTVLRESYGGRVGHFIEPAIEPLGFDWKIGVGILGAFAAREVFVSTMGIVYGLDEDEGATSNALRDRVREERWPDGRRVFTPLVCFSLMVFFALACQCMSTLAVVKRETRGWRWPTFLFGYMTALAWVASLAVYQSGRLLGF